MADKTTQRSEPDLDEESPQPAANFNEKGRLVKRWADAECIYDEEEYQRIEKALPCDPSVDKTQFRPAFRKMAVALIADSMEREETANNSAARNELVKLKEWLDWAVMRLDGDEFRLSAAGKRLGQAVRESGATWQEIPVVVSNVRKLRNYCERAISGIPTGKENSSKSALPALKLLLDFWHEVSGRSALTQSKSSTSSDETCDESCDEFKNFATAFIKPLQEAGYIVPDPTNYQARMLLNHR